MNKTFYLLFISYRYGTQYNALHTSIGNVLDAIKELQADIETDDVITKDDIITSINKREDYFHEFPDGTWIHVQELSPYLTEELIKTIKEENL